MRSIPGLVAACMVLLHCGALSAAGPSADAETPSWKTELPVLRVGVVVSADRVGGQERLRPFLRALERTLGVPVKLLAAPDYATLLETHASSRLDYAVYSASAFSAGWVLCKCVEPLMAPASIDGSKAFRAVLYVRLSSARSLADLRGKTILIPGKDSFAGYRFPADRLMRQGGSMGDRGWLLRDMETMDAALAAFKAGEGDALLGWEPELGVRQPVTSARLRGTLAKLGDTAREVSGLWKSDRIVHGPHAIRKELPDPVRSILRAFLGELKERDIDAYEAIEPYFSGGFKPVTLEDYRPVIEMIRKPVLFPGSR